MPDTSIDADFNAAIAYIARQRRDHEHAMKITIMICIGSISINVLLVILAWVMP
jgi:hypothetical protein